MLQESLRLLGELRKYSQGRTETDSEGKVWREVFPRDIHLEGMTPAQRAGYLSALQKMGLYKKTGEHFGMVQLQVSLAPVWAIQLQTAYGWKPVEYHYHHAKVRKSLKNLRATYPNRQYRVQPYNNQA